MPKYQVKRLTVLQNEIIEFIYFTFFYISIDLKSRFYFNQKYSHYFTAKTNSTSL
jgi:hypothetical protein